MTIGGAVLICKRFGLPTNPTILPPSAPGERRLPCWRKPRSKFRLKVRSPAQSAAVLARQRSSPPPQLATGGLIGLIVLRCDPLDIVLIDRRRLRHGCESRRCKRFQGESAMEQLAERKVRLSRAD